MATSGSYDFTLNRDSLYLLAYQAINIYDEDATTADLTTGHKNLANNIFNGLTKAWQNEGIKLWKRRIGYVFTAYGQHNYELGNVTNANHCTTSYHSRTLTASKATNATVLAVSSTTGMTANDFVGITLDSGIRFWTTIVSVDTTTQITITTGLTSAATSGNILVTYTSKFNRPLRILNANTLNLSSSYKTESTMSLISHDEYFKFPIKNTPGDPNNFYYDRQLNNTLPYTGTLKVYPEPNNVNTIMSIEFLDGIQDMDASTDNTDFPQEWIYPLAINLAAELAWFYGKFTELQQIQPKADALKLGMSLSDSDDAAMTFSISTKKY